MSKDKMEYEKTGNTKGSLRTLEHTDTGEVIKHLTYRHRVGLLFASTTVLVGYIVYDKFINIFI